MFIRLVWGMDFEAPSVTEEARQWRGRARSTALRGSFVLYVFGPRKTLPLLPNMENLKYYFILLISFHLILLPKLSFIYKSLN